MGKLISFLMGGLLTLTIGSGVSAQQKEKSCNVSAYIKDRTGINVRSGAGANFDVLGTIPFNRDGTMVAITASSGKWVKISVAQTAEGESVFSKRGWVFAPSLAVTAIGQRQQSARAYLSPARDSKVVASLSIDTEYSLEACDADWLKISIPREKSFTSGWIPTESQCGNPWNSCS